jgi:two-component system, response regulator
VGASEGLERWMLVVEDNLDDERLATRVFNKSGRTERLVIARDGAQALKILRENPPPTLVLLDLKLPRLSGIEVLMAIRDDGRIKCVPIVVLTSSDEKTDVAACYDLGCNAFIKKAVEYEQYVSELRTTLDFWLTVNRAPPIASPETEEPEPAAV